MFKFEHIEYLYFLAAIPLFTVLYLYYIYWRRNALHKFGNLPVVSRLMPLHSFTRRTFKFILLMLAYTFLVIGLANPQVGSRLEKVERKGSDLIIALDVSNSMLAQDIRPDRLTRSTQAISRLIDKLGGDRIGIVVFAGRAYTQLPMTSDYSAAKMFLSTISTKSVPTQGTAIGEAIELAMNSFKDDKRSKAIIIITDGENHEGDVVEMASEAAAKGIGVYTVGMGLPEGAPVPDVNERGQVTGYKKDRQGQTVVSRLDEKMLQQIAAAGNGKFIMANNQRDGLEKMLDEINKLEKTKFEERMFSDYEDRFQYFLAIALILLIIEFMLLDRKLKWISKLNLIRHKL